MPLRKGLVVVAVSSLTQVRPEQGKDPRGSEAEEGSGFGETGLHKGLRHCST